MRGALPSDRGPGRSHCSDRGDEQAARYSRLPPPLALRSARRGAAEGCSHARPLAQTQLVVGDAWFVHTGALRLLSRPRAATERSEPPPASWDYVTKSTR
jgi:hypothetical protein